MAAGRDPIDRLVDVMVATPICTYVAARRVVPLVGRAVRDRLLPAAEMMTESAIDLAGDAVAASDAAAAMPAETDGDEVEPSSTPVAADALPIDDYDHLAARQVVDRLDGLTADELTFVDRYEREHRHRQTVLRKIEQLQS